MIAVENISKFYYQSTILRDVSFSLKEGEIVGLLGPNGAGKTTLMRIINRIVEPDKGHVTFKGDLLKEKHLIEIGYLPEERGLYREMTVENQIVFLGRLRGLTKKDAIQQLNYWMDKFEINDWRKKRIEELSKGMAQKIQFICAVLHEPNVLILDEPFSGFDPINLDLIRKEILHFKAKGKSIIISTHNMNSVEEICDRAILINKGEKLLEGEIQTLREDNKEGVFKITFQGNMIGFVNALWVGYEVVDKAELGKDLFRVRLKMRHDNTINNLLKTIMDEVHIISVEEELPSMENVFVKTVQIQKTTVNE